MYFIINFILCLFIVSNAFAEEKNQPQIPLAYHVFTSGTYDLYFEQLQQFIVDELAEHPILQSSSDISNTTFQQAGLQLIRWIENGPSLNTVEAKRAFHKNLITKVRTAIELKEKDPHNDVLTSSLSAFVDNLCVWMYTQPKLMKAMGKFMENNFPREYGQHANPFQWIDHLQTLFDSINNDPRFNSTVEYAFHTTHSEGDIPSHLFSIFAGDHEVRVIRTPNTTFDYQGMSGEINAAVMPEFLNYLSALSKQGKNHLYINFMARQSSDKRKTDILEALESNPQFGQSIAVISLARNSDFYEQRKSYSNLDDVKTFKEVFIQELFADSAKSNYHWSNKLELSDWKENVRMILDNVHTQYFFNQERLTIEERMQFIDVAYIQIIEHIIALLQPDVVNLSCAITIDRGPTAYTLLYIDLLLKQKQTIDAEDLKTIETLVYGPGALIRNRKIDPVHNRHFINAARRLQSAAQISSHPLIMK